MMFRRKKTILIGILTTVAFWVIAVVQYEQNVLTLNLNKYYGRGTLREVNISYSQNQERVKVISLLGQNQTQPHRHVPTTVSHMSSGFNSSNNIKPQPLADLHFHINVTAASILRSALNYSGISTFNNLQVYLYPSPKKGAITITRKRLHVFLSPQLEHSMARPDGSPWLPEAETCAVIGNGGILIGSKCGDEIDAHDLVFRSNMADISEFFEDVGGKTNLMSVNMDNSKNLNKCVRFSKCRSRLLQYMRRFKGTIWWFSKYGTFEANSHYIRSVIALRRYLPGTIYGYPRKSMIPLIEKFWNTTKTPSSGLYLHAVAASACKKISMYGFYPFNQTKSGHALPFHYYEKVSFKNKHNIPEEYMKLVEFNRTGVIRLVTKQCRPTT
ncbi:CMP-N-acetylneuraminate-poly-alpha-2,8-sialyltransferase-like isoform X2 [Antedon mediterranea]|uniref:CMP-N-acetylneuraminate-poly-alpha-2, 8-sialyltransferase-like isoform X2 n=1 Tax=Antedon mediterranea TaxID=105859 RepID=UPI003AF74DF9